MNIWTKQIDRQLFAIITRRGRCERKQIFVTLGLTSVRYLAPSSSPYEIRIMQIHSNIVLEKRTHLKVKPSPHLGITLIFFLTTIRTRVSPAHSAVIVWLVLPGIRSIRKIRSFLKIFIPMTSGWVSGEQQARQDKLLKV